MSVWLHAGRRAWARGAWLAVLAVVLLSASLALASCSAMNNNGNSTTSTAPAAGGTTSTVSSGSTSTSGTSTTVGGVTSSGAAGDLASPATRVAQQVAPSVVDVEAADAQGNTLGIGSGVIYSQDGVIVTNNHVVTAEQPQPAAKLTVTLASGQQFPATLVGRDSISDLAVIRIQKTGLPAAHFLNDLSTVQVGDYAIAIGTPLGLEGTVTLGIVSAVKREITVTANQPPSDYIQTDAAISPGNSGGALVDANGDVIGINAAGLQPQSGAQNIGFAIPSDLVVSVVEQIMKTGTVSYAYLGIQSSDLDAQLRQQLGLGNDVQGAVVVAVQTGSPAAAAGLQQGDVITSLAGKTITSSGDLFSALRGVTPGQQVQITILRAGKQQTLSITPSQRPTG